MNFTHLHVHSHYSLLDGLAKIDDFKMRFFLCYNKYVERD